MKKLNWILLLVGLSLFMISCSDDDNSTNPDDNDYFELDEGATYTYNYFDRDDNNKNVNSSKTLEIFSVKGKETALGLSGVNKVEVTRDNGNNEIMYFADKEDKYYAELMFVLPELDFDGVQMPFENTTNRMVVIADNKTAEWNIHTENINSFDVPLAPGIVAKVSGTFDIKGTKGSTEDITYNGEKLKARKFTINYYFLGAGEVSFGTIPIEFTLEMHFYFAEDIGLVRQVFPSRPIEVVIAGLGSQTFQLNGFERMLVNFKDK